MSKSPKLLDRVSADDLMSLVSERDTSPMQVGAVLMLDAQAGLDPVRAKEQIARRLIAVPRLRQRLLNPPFGCGRPVWVDDAAFEIDNHMITSPCPAPGSEQAVLDVAAELMAAPLPHDRPLWTATLVSDVGHGKAALVLVFHHVLADGIGGLAVLSRLVDGVPEASEPAFPRPNPTVRQLIVDSALGRFRSLGRVPSSLRRVVRAVGQLRPAATARAAQSSLNQPTGARRRFVSIRVGLVPVRAVAHEHGATVNDAVLTAIVGALHRLLVERGEPINRFIVSVPFSARRQTTARDLGNQSGVIPLAVPGVGDPIRRLQTIAGITATAKRAAHPGASTALLGPLFRLLARAGLYQRFIRHQRLIHTFVTKLRGPEIHLWLFGCPITSIIPLGVATGNVTVAFAVMTYVDELAITIIADPDACPDLPFLRQALVDELNGLILEAD